MAEKKTKVLFVDDEESIRLTLPLMLHEHGFEVTTAASVPDALGIIMQYPFDVLIADLNIGHPGDGFTVVSAMRSTQPHALRFILTGYPDFETALEAIRQEVHDYLIKPTDTDTLVEKIRAQLGKQSTLPTRVSRKRVVAMIREQRESIIQKWLELAQADEVLGSQRLREDGAGAWFDAVISIAEGKQGGTDKLPSIGQPEKSNDFQRVVRSTRLLQVAIGTSVQTNLLSTDLSHLVPDLVRVFGTIQTLLEQSTRPDGAARKDPKKPAKKR